MEKQMVTFTEIKEAEKMGEYKPTAVDQRKKEVDFLIKQVNPYFIRWKDGKGEMVTKRQLTKLEKSYSSMTDF